ncbi:hypothetical protein PR202_ga15762 [Eleusine coracana subsp. coracana]|uniref:FLZ-type domain-containing protein n=1 Tax=Eleusine coracana subsp. coracana TaxID=191504 RepID=A0AAV5CKI4_ELECO|nr:hypothetical protein QOZ80_6BG0489330 [Eleusine coracana subsp. coracana]GJM98730.1 hypothetical protein PR202_ga15762 [Eleusine coracana subsp. coracana]
MLLRRHRSIFHLGEEGGAQHSKSVTERDAVVGLRILVAHNQHRQNARTPPPSCSHIVLKKMVLPTSSAAARRHRACGFLRTCTRCRRELSPDKDVYMYRGDEGFCSEECRRQQILRDEARERDAVIKKRWQRVSMQHHHEPRSAVRGAPRRLLAVA